MPVRLGEGRTHVLLQRARLAQAPRFSWAESLAINVEGREMLHEGAWLVRRPHHRRTHNFRVGRSDFNG
jgi:hypothetical protein